MLTVTVCWLTLTFWFILLFAEKQWRSLCWLLRMIGKDFTNILTKKNQMKQLKKILTIACAFHICEVFQLNGKYVWFWRNCVSCEGRPNLLTLFCLVVWNSSILFVWNPILYCYRIVFERNASKISLKVDEYIKWLCLYTSQNCKK